MSFQINSIHDPVCGTSYQLSWISTAAQVDLHDLPESVREKIVEFNLTSVEPYLLSPLACERTPANRWVIFKEAFHQKYQKEGWSSIALLVMKIAVVAGVFIAVGVGTFYVVKYFMDSSRANIGKCYNVTTYVSGIPINRYRHCRTNIDHYMDCSFYVFIGLCAITCIGLAISVLAREIIEIHIDRKYPPMRRDFKNSYLHTLKFKKIDSPMKNVNLDELANGRDPETGEIMDPILYENIPSREQLAAKTQVIGKYAVPIQTVFTFFLSKKNGEVGQIPHPFQHGFLSEGDREIFFKDVSTLLCTSKEKLQACWNEIDEAEIEDEVEKFALQTYGARLWAGFQPLLKPLYKAKIKESLKVILRNRKIKAIIPATIRSKYFSFDDKEFISYIPL